MEHHLHIEGTLEPELLFELAEKNGIELPKEEHKAFASTEALKARYQDFQNLDDFLVYYYIGMRVLVTAADYERLAWEYLKRFAADGGVHAELSFDALEHTNRGIAYRDIVAGLTAARRRASTELGVSTELICCFVRHLPVADALRHFDSEEFQASLDSGDVVGIGLDSTEINKPPREWKELYDRAEAKGIRRTAHAGEEGPAAYVKSALDDLHVQRIDHGIRVVEDPEILAQVAKRGVMLTVCPISSKTLNVVPTIGKLPIRTFLDAGVKFSINSDDPAYFGSDYILNNYCAVQDAFGLSVGEWRRIARTAIEGSWCSDARKQELLTKLEQTA